MLQFTIKIVDSTYDKILSYKGVKKIHSEY